MDGPIDPEAPPDRSAASRLRRAGLVFGAVLGLYLLFEPVTGCGARTDDAYVRSGLVAVAPEVTGRIVANK